jgi:hypothetical protein
MSNGKNGRAVQEIYLSKDDITHINAHSCHLAIGSRGKLLKREQILCRGELSYIKKNCKRISILSQRIINVKSRHVGLFHMAKHWIHTNVVS